MIISTDSLFVYSQFSLASKRPSTFLFLLSSLQFSLSFWSRYTPEGWSGISPTCSQMYQPSWILHRPITHRSHRSFNLSKGSFSTQVNKKIGDISRPCVRIFLKHGWRHTLNQGEQQSRVVRSWQCKWDVRKRKRWKKWSRRWNWMLWRRWVRHYDAVQAREQDPNLVLRGDL